MLSRALAAILLGSGSILPVSAGRWLAEKIGALVYLAPRARRGLLENARHILGGESTPAERRSLALAVLRNFGRSVHDLLVAHRRWKSVQELPLKVIGRERFDGLAASGKGFIAASLHLGSYEIGSMVLAERCPSAAIVYHRDPAGFFEKLRSRQRALARLEEIAIDASPFFAIELSRRLREGGAILMAGELEARRRGERFRFLHGFANFSLWPARLAIHAGAPVLPAFTVREADGSFCLHLEEPLHPRPHEEPARFMARLVEVFERYVKKFPEQWLMVRPFWAEEEDEVTRLASAGGKERGRWC
ncbi:MAG: lysophospholipid acyltransferase family protein [Planctomycetes bacterium]|nr:lysophospholipid acyltransferase family protein [Planctomycetota bacterium]